MVSLSLHKTHECQEDTMSGNRFPIRGGKLPYADEADDVEGHGYRPGADAESAEGDDTEGHMPRAFADAESTEGGDTEGHGKQQT